jgi:hypothetical protein
MSAKKDFPENDKKYYRNLVAMIINNDADKKKVLDGRARVQIATFKEQLPDADDETMVFFLASMAHVVARIMATPLQEVSEMIERIFDTNVVAVASVMDAYDIDSKTVPKYDPPAHDDDDDPQGARMTPEQLAEVEKIINRQYL